MSQWYAVIDKATGAAVSFGTDLADSLPATLVAVPINHQPTREEMWDAATKVIVARPAPPPDPLAADYAKATTAEAKLDAIAKRLGLL